MTDRSSSAVRRRQATKKSILLVGAGGHARACIDVIEQQGTYRILGLIGLPAEVGTKVLGYVVLGTDGDLPIFRKKIAHAIVTIGQIKSPRLRMQAFATLKQYGFSLPAVVSPRAYVSPHAQIGAGVVVMHGAVVNAGAVIGPNCIINSNALIEHDAYVEAHCHIATAAVLNGGVHIGAGTFVGSNSTVRQDTSVGEQCLIGMGQHVLDTCERNTWIPTPKRSL